MCRKREGRKGKKEELHGNNKKEKIKEAVGQGTGGQLFISS